MSKLTRGTDAATDCQMRWLSPGLFVSFACVLSGCFELPKLTPAPMAETDPALQPPVAQHLSFADGRAGNFIVLGRTQTALWVKDNRDLATKVALVRINELTTDSQRQVAKIPSVLILRTPFQTELTNEEGKSILVSVQGRDESSVRFTRMNETTVRSYVFPLSKLSPDTRELIEGLPVINLSALQEPSPALTARQRALVRAKENLDRLNNDASKPGMGGVSRYREMRPQIEAATKEVDRLNREVIEMEEQERAAAERKTK